MARKSSKKARGALITFEGGEGAGKSTQIELLRNRLSKAGHTVVMTREPGGAPGAEEIRRLLVTGAPERWTPMTEALLNYAARQEHLGHIIRPALAQGDWVLCDRFSDSTRAYQGYAGGVDLAILQKLDALVVGRDRPDLTVILDIDPAVGLERAGKRNSHENRFERKGLAYHQSIRQAFIDIATAEPARCVLIDAEQSIERIGAQIWSAICEKLPAAAGGES